MLYILKDDSRDQLVHLSFKIEFIKNAMWVQNQLQETETGFEPISAPKPFNRYSITSVACIVETLY